MDENRLFSSRPLNDLPFSHLWRGHPTTVMVGIKPLDRRGYRGEYQVCTTPSSCSALMFSTDCPVLSFSSIGATSPVLSLPLMANMGIWISRRSRSYYDGRLCALIAQRQSNSWRIPFLVDGCFEVIMGHSSLPPDLVTSKDHLRSTCAGYP